MVDKSDMLMHITLLDFLREWLDTLAGLRLEAAQVDWVKKLMRMAAVEDPTVGEMVAGLRVSPATTEELGTLLEKLELGGV